MVGIGGRAAAQQAQGLGDHDAQAMGGARWNADAIAGSQGQLLIAEGQPAPAGGNATDTAGERMADQSTTGRDASERIKQGLQELSP